MKPSEAFKRLTTRVNIDFYVGPQIAKVIQDACDAADVKETKVTAKQEKSPAPTEVKKGK